MKIKEKPAERVWHDFTETVSVTDEQLQQFQTYADLLLEWNEKYNLTAITSLAGVVQQHFVDSLALDKAMDLNNVSLLVDIGSGAGLPGIPLKIMYPHLKMILIEVTHKKQVFLQEVIECLKLDNVEVAPLDFRTFVRTTEALADLFISRAALSEVELTRIFRENSPYKNATLVYWVSEQWECNPKVEKYLVDTIEYQVKHKKRSLAVFKHP